MYKVRLYLVRSWETEVRS